MLIFLVEISRKKVVVANAVKNYVSAINYSIYIIWEYKLYGHISNGQLDKVQIK